MSVTVSLLEFSIILGYRVKVFIATGVFSWFGVIGFSVLLYIGVLHNIVDSG